MRPTLRSASGTAAAAAIVCAAFAPSAFGEVRYAEQLGDGPEPCLQSNPCEIERAVEGTVPADVSNDDEIVVLPGTYSNLGEVQINKAIDVHGSSLSPPSLHTGAGTGVSVEASGATLRDVRILHSSGSFGLAMNNAVTVERVQVRSIGAGAGTACWVGGGTLRDSVCLNNRTGSGDALAYQISGATTRSSVVRNVTAVSTAPASYGARYGSGSGATVTVDAKNVIFDGVAGDVRGDESSSTTTVTIDHSNYADVTITGGAEVTPAASPTNQTAAPQFVDPSALPFGDFRQLPGSPTVDAGITDPSLGATDLDGDSRLLGAAPDIGADELVPAPPVPPAAAPDVTPPETKIDKQPKRKGKKRKARFAFSSTEPGSSFECRFDKGAFEPCASPLKRKVKRRKHRFEVRAIDPAGNVDPTPATARWKVRKG